MNMWRRKCGGCDVIGRPMELILLIIILHQTAVRVRGEDVSSKTTTPVYGTLNGTFNGKPCSPSSLDECWSKLPSMKEPNIPTTSKEVEIACTSFQIGMDCVDNYSKQCLNLKQRQQVKSTVRGAHETFSFLCKDEKFRAEFLSHAVCYRKISGKWDNCAAHFIASLKKVDQKEPLSICCVRLRFLQCVTELARLHCNRDAERFLQKMAETLVTSNMKNKNSSECFHVKSANCSLASGACSSIKLSLLQQPSNLIINLFVNVFPSSTAAGVGGTVRSLVSHLLKLFSLENMGDWMSLGVLSLGEWMKWCCGGGWVFLD
ncbi:uncharacterized protein LOC118435070 [Folsomia candida]|uniref:Uncharacterized protein n=1 Tax=Folsomia candida TaxID=158441 RepID=A0A226ENA7_FOLCA|nr:uncharacterized protein LOC118435070 [Folsomia candida]OXA58617.1 hypothetical protein Fcan01_07124 [Folsomia candida]